METVKSQYSIGDWVVHQMYGVGQIKKIKSRSILGKKVKCFEVMTKDSTYWFPTDQKKNPRIRPVSSKDMIEKVIKALRRKSNKLDVDRKLLKKEIAKVQSEGDLVSISKIIRDLSAHQVVRKLNQYEETALNKFKTRLSREWAAITKSDTQKIEQQMAQYIKESKHKINIEVEKT
jgi:RNA polymerase-interacting CarD/CdnL/TRCF family regulator